MENIKNVLEILELKKKYIDSSIFRNIRYYGRKNYDEILTLIQSNNDWKEKMYSEYFVKKKENLYTKNINYNPEKDCSIIELLIWANKLMQMYNTQINLFIEYKKKYEDALFNGKIDEAHAILSQIENRISYSVWGIQQRFLLYTLDENKGSVEQSIKEIEDRISSNCASLLIYFYSKMTDVNIDYKKYLEKVYNFLGTADSKSVVWKYFNYKLNIATEKELQEIKIALVVDEQVSILDYYETFVEALQLLYRRENVKGIISEIIGSTSKTNIDYRVRNLDIAIINGKGFNVNSNICNIIEEYTCGNYEVFDKMWENNKTILNSDFTMCNIFIKAGMHISSKNCYFKGIWEEIEKIYNFEHVTEISIEKISGYYKLLYGTSWRYKLLGVLIRKLNYSFDGNILCLSILNDKELTPLFHQCIEDNNRKEIYLEQFSNNAPATIQLQKYMITGVIDEHIFNKIDPSRRKYYYIKQLLNMKQYKECISCSSELIRELNNQSLYVQERVRRILFECYVQINEIIEAMELYVDSYLVGSAQITHMNLESIIKSIEEDDVQENVGNICRPIILSIYYKNTGDEVLSSYLDYLESQKCTTIVEYLEQISTVSKYQIYLLEKVCSQKLLLRDYVSKTIVNGSAAELRAIILKKLLEISKGNGNEYITELNSIYKEMQLGSMINSFNHNRIFIDKENLINYLKEDIEREFAKFKVVQEIRTITGGRKISLGDIEFLGENYWDQTKFFTAMTEKIQKQYLNESPYSLEDFLSTRIRHNYCNDKLKRVFEEEKIFSKKETDISQEYKVNEFWKTKLNEVEYENLSNELSNFSRKIDEKIQEVKAKWIRIRKDDNSEGMFDYLGFSYDFINYVVMDFQEMLNNPDEFLRGVIQALDLYTEQILKNIRNRINGELRQYYFNEIVNLETSVKVLKINDNIRAEVLRRIEVTKARYNEDIEGFADIFNIENEKYPDFTFNELVDICCQVESEMNKEFSVKNVILKNESKCIYSGVIFPYMVDIFAILIRNAVQHSKIIDLNKLKIEIEIKDANSKTIPQEITEQVPIRFRNQYSTIISIKNNLSSDIDETLMNDRVNSIIQNIVEHNYRDESNKEGGSGLYKIARTVDYNLNTIATLYNMESKGLFNLMIIIDLHHFIKERD